MQYATRACELTRWRKWWALDALAAACARSLDCAAAIAWQVQAIQMAPKEEKPALKSRQVSYETGEAFSEASPKVSFRVLLR